MDIKYLTDFSLSRYTIQGNFIVGSHAQIESHARLIKKNIGPISIPFLERLRRRTINLTLQSKYSLGARPPGTKSSPTTYIPVKVMNGYDSDLSYIPLCDTRLFYGGGRAQIKTHVWHKAILWWELRTNRNTCAAGAKVSLMGRHVIKLPLQAGKISKQPPGMNARWRPWGASLTEWVWL